MTRLPTVRPVDMVAALKKAGFVEKRQKGIHLVLWHETKRLTTIVAMHGHDLSDPTLKKILRQAGFSTDELIQLL